MCPLVTHDRYTTWGWKKKLGLPALWVLNALLLRVLRRFDAVAEPRRRELFTQYCNLLAEAGELAGGAMQAPAVGAGEAPPAPAEDAVQLDRLREEQAKLKEEYDRWVRS